MAQEEIKDKQETTPETSGTQTQSTEEKTENMVPSYRLKEEADKRRAAENKLAEYEKKDKEKADEELTYKERLEKELVAHSATKAAIAKKELQSDFVSKLVVAGIELKIASLLSKAEEDLTVDNIDDKVKAAKKEYGSDKKVEDTKPQSPFFNAQPSASQITSNVDLSMAAAEAIMKKNKLA